MFLNQDSALNDAGIYGVNMYALGIPHTVIVDDYLPVAEQWDNESQSYVEGTVFNKISRDGSLWASILEKAFAKFHGNYRHIIAGDPRNSARTLFGGPHKFMDHTNTSEDSLWTTLMEANSQNDIIQAGTDGSDDTQTQADGLVKGHAYTVLHAQELSNGAKLVKLRNPWGEDSRQRGDYSDNSNLWTDALKQEAGFTAANDGITWMTIADFRRQFSYSMVNLDTTDMHHAAFLKLDDRSTDRPGDYS